MSSPGKERGRRSHLRLNPVLKRYRKVGCGVWGEGSTGTPEQGETIHNLRVNHTTKNGFGIRLNPLSMGYIELAE
jgi:hypothetical protein